MEPWPRPRLVLVSLPPGLVEVPLEVEAAAHSDQVGAYHGVDVDDSCNCNNLHRDLHKSAKN